MSIEIGDEAPDFELPDQDRNPVRLSSYRGRKAVVLVFYPLAFTGTCQGELCAIRDEIADFDNDDVQTLAVSVDSTAVHAKWAAEQGYSFPLLADFWPHGAVAQAYEVFNETTGFANRGTFVVDKGGIIRFAEMNGPGEARDQSAWDEALGALAS